VTLLLDGNISRSFQLPADKVLDRSIPSAVMAAQAATHGKLQRADNQR
jgi:hypothetical protein